jgi:16S rRNA G966 N2-methylase RsmD
MEWDYNDYVNDDYPRTTLRHKIVSRKRLDWIELWNYKDDFDAQNYQLQSLQSLESLESLQRLESLERLQSLQSLERLERLERLESLESKQSINLHNKDYRELDIPAWDVIYCDPPYENSSQYKIWDFDSVAFRERAEEKSKTNPVFVSSYIGRDWRNEIDTGKWNIMSKKDWKHTDHKEKIFYKWSIFI